MIDPIVITEAPNEGTLVIVVDTTDYDATVVAVPELIVEQSSGELANNKGFVDATTDSTIARPTGFTSVEWLITSSQDEPINMTNLDTLVVIP